MIKLSRFLSFILRHKPQAVNVTLDNQGYVDVKELIDNINKTKYVIDMGILENLVNSDDKSRYSFNKDKTKIRANQGHSVNIDLGLIEIEPPDKLYHGTAQRYLSSIRKQGLQRQQRLHVHLTDNVQTANSVGSRHGVPVILEINASKMHEDRYKFYKSENEVWLTSTVPAEYLKM